MKRIIITFAAFLTSVSGISVIYGSGINLKITPGPEHAAVPGDPPVANNVQIAGNPRSGLTLYGVYFYSDADGDPEGDSEFKWYYSSFSNGASPVVIPGAETTTFYVPDALMGKYIGFSVKPVALTGDNYDTAYFSVQWVGPVMNDPPVASAVSISGSKDAGGALLGSYIFSDTEGDIESGSVYEWSSASSAGGPFTVISGETGKVHIIKMDEQGKYFRFSVTPKAASGNNVSVKVTSASYGPANSKPWADNVTIGGIATVGSTLNGSYQFHDVDGDLQGATQFQWFREAEPIPGATSQDYIITTEDVDSRLRFRVIPVSSTGYPDTGDPVMSAYTAVVTDPASGLPVASEVCISGTREAGSELTGKYHYENKYSEKNSIYLWLRGTTVIKSGTTPDMKKYTLTGSDMDNEIRFAVIPRNSRAQKGDTAFSETLAIFTLPRETFSVADPDILLTANPSGGIFWGEGVTDGYFSPSSVDYTQSPFRVNYQLTINNTNTTCIQNASKDLTVTGITMYFDSFRDVYCQNGGLDTIYLKNLPPGTLISLFYCTTPDAIAGLLDETTLLVDPSKLRAGNKVDTLFFQAVSLFSTLTIQRPFVVDSISQVSILNLADGSAFCNNSAPFELFVSHPGGLFEGPVVNRVFEPSMASGNINVKYTYTTKQGCVSSTTVPVIINPAPSVSFSLTDNCIESINDSIRFINTTSSADPVSSWLWEFYDAGGSSARSEKDPAYLYKTGGLHRVTLKAVTTNNCQDFADTIIDLGIKPKADFTFLRDCYQAGDSLWLFDATVSGSLITSRSWNFFDGDSLHTVLNPRYPKKATGYLPVEYVVRTNYPGCYDTVRRQIFIRPTVSITSDGYFENFESGNGGWVKDNMAVNNWSFGTPDRSAINHAASGMSAWFTRYDIADQKSESYSVVSPCFDFTTVQKPMLSLKIWRHFDRNRDGAALQYSTSDNESWQYIGSLEDGINWYNSTLIRGRPGGDQLGWTSSPAQDNGWVEAGHRLDEVAGKSGIKFRFVYGSDGTSQDNDGFAFDDIFIGQRTREILLEHFTNNGSVRASNATTFINGFVKRNSEDIINIQYHSNFPGSDLFYTDNPGDISARLLFYGLARVPYAFFDGGTGQKYAGYFNFLSADADTNEVIRRSLVKPSFNIDLNASVSGGVLTVSGKIKALEPVNETNLTLYIAVTEKEKTVAPADAGALGEKTFFNIFRKFIPDAGGISLKKSWNLNEEFNIPEKTWVIEKVSNNADIEIIAFIQNNSTKEIYQTVSDISTYTGGGKGVAETPETEKTFALYPNPAINQVTITFDEPLEKTASIVICDYSGTILRTYTAGSGVSEFRIDHPGLKDGLYLVRIVENGVIRAYRKLVISGR